MNQVTRWFDHPLYRWMDEQAFSDMEGVLRANCRDSVIGAVLSGFENISLEGIEYYPAGTYSEPEKTVLDNIPDFWLVRMRQRVAKNTRGHSGSIFPSCGIGALWALPAPEPIMKWTGFLP